MTNARPFILCLTGSLGMGKSRTAQFFAELGVPVHDSDAVVHALYENEAVPPSRMPSQARPRREKSIGRNLRKWSSATTPRSHGWRPSCIPWSPQARDKFLADAQTGGASVVVLDIPLLFETAGQRGCDAVVVVSAPAEIQRQRAFERPGMTEEKFSALLAKQTPDAEKRRRADFIVDSSQSFDHARAQVRDILQAVAKMRESAGDS